MSAAGPDAQMGALWWMEQANLAIARAQAAEADNEDAQQLLVAAEEALGRAEATVERVRALCDEADVPRETWAGTPLRVGTLTTERVRAALADPKDYRRCLECATIHPETECPA